MPVSPFIFHTFAFGLVAFSTVDALVRQSLLQSFLEDEGFCGPGGSRCEFPSSYNFSNFGLSFFDPPSKDTFFNLWPRKAIFLPNWELRLQSAGVTEVVISVNACFILRCVGQCFSSPASCSCLMSPWRTVWRKGTPCTAAAAKARARSRQLCGVGPSGSWGSWCVAAAAGLSFGVLPGRPSLLPASCVVPRECRSPQQSRIHGV